MGPDRPWPRPRRVAPVVRFELARRARARSTLLALLLYALVAGAGAWRGVDAFAGYAWTLAALPVLRFGAGADRRHRFDACLAGNFLAPAELLLARSAVFVATALALGALALLGGVGLAGSPARAAVQASTYTLAALLAAPAILLAELTLGVRAPFAVVLLLYLAALLVADPIVGAEAVVRATGLPIGAPGFGGLEGLALRVLGVTPVGLALLVPLHRRRALAP